MPSSPKGYSHGSKSDEYGTPPYIMEAVARVLDVIDLDPASTFIANKVVRAKKFYTRSDDGLSKPWYGNVWLNPPFSSPLVGKFCLHLIEEFEAGHIHEFVALMLVAPSTKWQSPLIANNKLTFAFSTRRETFLGPDGKWLPSEDGKPAYIRTPIMFVYGGPNRDKFISEFRRDNFSFIPNV